MAKKRTDIPFGGGWPMVAKQRHRPTDGVPQYRPTAYLQPATQAGHTQGSSVRRRSRL